MTSVETNSLQHGSLKFTNEILHEPSRRMAPLYSYTREFLLSLREKEVCKRVPAEFDSSLLSEIEEAASHSLEWQPSRRNDHGSSTLGRVNNARWETRSSGSNDKDGNANVVSDSFHQDHGRRGANQHQRPGQKPEKDGLLGSGSFPRASGFQGWNSGSKDREEGPHQLQKSSEPYQPPRPFKSGLHSRKDITDTYNDETFGSFECSDQNRHEEERIRRESFELMRQEQRKTFHEKQKNVQRTHEKSDISSLFEKREVEVLDNISKGDSLRPSLIMNTAASRPLVPPGFSSAVSETSLIKQTSGFSLESKVTDKGMAGNSVVVHNPMVVACEDSFPKEANNSGSLAFASGLGSNSEPIILAEHSSSIAPGPFEFEDWGNIVTNGSNEKDSKSAGEADSSGQANSTSLLRRLFGNSAAENGATKAVEGAAVNEAKWSPPQPSIFSSWFIEDAGKPAEDSSSRDLISMILTKEKANLPSASENTETSLKFDGSERPTMLTCEDLEQSMLAHVEVASSSEPLTKLHPNFSPTKADVDNHASEHLLSLLFKSKEVSTVPDDTEVVAVDSGKSLTLEALFGSAFMKELHSKDTPISGQKHAEDDMEIPSKENIGTIIGGRSPDWIDFEQSSMGGINVLNERPGTETINERFLSSSSSSFSSFPDPRNLGWPNHSPEHLQGPMLPPQLQFAQYNQQIGPPQMRLSHLENSAHIHQHDHFHHLLHQQHPLQNQGAPRFDPRFQFPIPPPHINMPLQYFPRGETPPRAVNSMAHASMHEGMHASQGPHHRPGYGMQIHGMAGAGPHPLGRQIDIEIIQQQQQHQRLQTSQPPSRFTSEISPDLRHRREKIEEPSKGTEQLDKRLIYVT